MSNSFIPASGDINFADLPSAKGKASWTLAEQALVCDLYEQEHPSATVRRPWETQEQHADRKAKRPVVKLPDPELSVPIHMAQMQLNIKTVELTGLPLDHPKYSEMFRAHVRDIHLLQDVLGQKHTRYVEGVALTKVKPESVPPETLAILAKYKAMTEASRREFIATTKNMDLLALISSVEVEPSVQLLATERIGQLGMKPVEAVKP